MHLGIDLDDVVVDFIGGVRKAFATEYGEEGIPEYNGSAWGDEVVAFTKHPLLLASGYKSWWDWLREREWLWAQFPAVPGAIGGLKILRNEGHYLEAVTSKPEWAEHNVWKWLGLWRPPFQRVTIINSQLKQRKVDLTDAELMVDDKEGTCQEFVDDGRRGVLLTHNDKVEAGSYGGMYVAHTWSEVVSHVRVLSKTTHRG